MLPASLPSLLAQDYPGRAEVFLVDDGSSDGTGELARGLARRARRAAADRGLARRTAGRAGRASCGPYATASRWHARVDPNTCC